MVKHGKLKFEYNKITSNIYLGTNQCCVSHFKKELLREKINSDISLEKERLDNPLGVKIFIWLPTKDHTAPTQKQLHTGVASMHALIKNKEKMYVHCQRGHGRAPTLVAAYLISTGMKINQAINYVKKKRPAVHPNKKQLAALKKFKKNWKNI